MTTITLKINERTKAGKAFMAMVETFLKDAKGIEIVETPVKEKSPYDPKFVSMLKKRVAKEKFTPITSDSIWESIK